MAQRVMLDTNVYTDQAYRQLAQRIRGLCVSGVVVQELMVIATREQRQALCADFREKVKLGDGVVPGVEDWLEVGKCLGQLCSSEVNDGKLTKYEVRQLAKDALLARTAMQKKAVLVTSNISDFAKIKRVFRSLAFKSPSEFFGTRPR